MYTLFICFYVKNSLWKFVQIQIHPVETEKTREKERKKEKKEQTWQMVTLCVTNAESVNIPPIQYSSCFTICVIYLMCSSSKTEGLQSFGKEDGRILYLFKIREPTTFCMKASTIFFLS